MAVNDERAYPVGIEYSSVHDIKSCIDATNANLGFDCCCVPIAHPLFKRELISGKCLNNYGPFTRSDIILVSYDWQLIVGKLSPYIDCDSKNENLRKSSEAVFLQELNYAAHLNLPAVMLPINGPNNANLARLLYSRFSNNHCAQQFWIRVPLMCPSVAASYYRKNVNMDEVVEPDTWQWWNQLRQLANSEKNIGVALEVGPDLPDEEVLSRWLGEPVRCALIPTNIFLTNKRGYPVLSKPHQAFVKALTLNDCKIFITGACRHENVINYRKYIEHLARRSNHHDPLVAYAQGYEDFLQYPLQPLSDNLESQTYEVFEKDPIKYKYYQDAIYHALLDRVPVQEKDKVQVVMIVGAGRGPLVMATLNASKNSGRKVKVYAVEKNPNAIVTLFAQKEEIWHDDVTVVPGDMRDFNPPDKADILVSELLGSFGDNELSPECLDGVQRVLKDDGISIPCSYTSYLSPIQSMRLYTEVRTYKERNKHPLAHFEMPYVVHQKNRYNISNVQELFTFNHPNRDEVLDNSRYKTLTFKMKADCTLHGFSGFFSAVLYKDITLSIEPSTHTPGMFSWFPIYFPIREPINLKASDSLIVHFWRCCNTKSVWYEWCISEPYPLSIHNSTGRSYSIGLH